MIPFLDLKKINERYRSELDDTFKRVLDSGWYIMGNELMSFEKEFAQFCGVDYCVGVGNGLEAIVISLKVLGIGPGDEVIVPSNTYIATWIAVEQVGATIVPVEPNAGTYNIDPNQIRSSITSKTKAIIPVHLYGQSCEMKEIMQIAEQYQLWVIEDNAQAQGADHLGKKTGGFGHINATSFYPGKNLGALGDGGAITTNNLEFAEKARMYRNYGSEKKYVNEIIGSNSRLDELQAAFLRIKLKSLVEDNAHRQAIAAEYIKGITLQNVGLILPKTADNCSHIYHIFAIQVDCRTQLMKYLEANGIQTLIHYPIAPHKQNAFVNFKDCSFPISENTHSNILSLPISPVQTMDETRKVIATLNRFGQ